jgi:phosphoglycolate phosphatase
VSVGLRTCLIFDLDGTILDSLPGVEFSVRAAFDRCRYPLPTRDLRTLIGPPIRKILAQAGDIRDEAALDALESAFRASYDSEGWRRTVCFPNAASVLACMRTRGQRLFVVSNKPRHISLRILSDQELLGLFEEIVTADSRVPAYAGKAEMLSSLLLRHAIAAEDCLFVGDTIEDAGAAAATGMGFVYMQHGYGDIPNSSPVPVSLRLESFAGFSSLLIQETDGDR